MPSDPEWAALVACLLAERRDLLGQVEILQNRLDREVGYLQKALRADRDLRTLTGDSPAMKQVRRAIHQVAATSSTVLLLGETGVGKELVARAIHQLSPRRDNLLVSVNCAALSQALVPSELFGHEAGAFSGAAKRRIGRFELAHQCTLFLDEIAEVSPETQVLLLRVLQERIIERVGGAEPIAVDVRVIAATHQDLPALVRACKFRADLFYRLNVFPIDVPPLRKRLEDLPDLVRHFIHQFNRLMNKSVENVSAESMRALSGYRWPGNVRELENLIERAMIVCDGKTLEIQSAWLVSAGIVSPIPHANHHLMDVERGAIEDALRASRGRIYGPDGAAKRLGLKPTTLYGKMRKLGIQRPGEQPEQP